MDEVKAIYIRKYGGLCLEPTQTAKTTMADEDYVQE